RYVSSALLVLGLLCVVAPPSRSAPLAIGAIEQVDARSPSITVLGQQYTLASATLVAGQHLLPGATSAHRLPLNTLVRIDGELRSDGTPHVSSVVVLPEINTPGDTAICVSGVVSRVDSNGNAWIGRLKIDTTQLVGEVASDIRVGSVIEVLGTQPQPAGPLLAESLGRATHGAGALQGVGGTGRLAGVGGTGKLQGVGGTGKIATLGVGGTGKIGRAGGGESGKIAVAGVCARGQTCEPG